MKPSASGDSNSARRFPIGSASALPLAATNAPGPSPYLDRGQTMALGALSTRGFVLAVLIQRRRDSRAEQRLMKKLLKSAGTPPRVMITDPLRYDVRGS